jgi:K+-transporting ATPase c subunit
MRRRPTDDDRWPEPDWKKLCTVAAARRMLEDAEAIVVDLSSRSRSSRDPFVSLGSARSGVEEIANK